MIGFTLFVLSVALVISTGLRDPQYHQLTVMVLAFVAVSCVSFLVFLLVNSQRQTREERTYKTTGSEAFSDQATNN